MRPSKVLTRAVFLAAGTTAWKHLTEAEVRAAEESSHEMSNEQPPYHLIAYTHPEDEASQALDPEWLKLKQMATVSAPSIRSGKISSVDCTESRFFKTFCQEKKVRSFPTIRLYRDDNDRSYERYRGPHMVSHMMAFLRRSLKPIVSIVDEKNITAFTGSDYVVFVGKFASSDKTKAENRFQEIAAKYRDRFSFGLEVGTNTEEGNSKVTCWNTLDDEKHETTRLETREMLEQFIKLCSTPLMPEMTRRNELSFYETRRSIVHYFTRNDQERDDYVKQMRPLAKKYREYLHFTTTDVNEYPDAPEMMGLEWGSSKGLSVQNPNNGDVYPYLGSQALSASVVELFLGEIIQGKVKPFVRGTDGDGAGQVGREHEEL